jgi:hypothetical protein
MKRAGCLLESGLGNTISPTKVLTIARTDSTFVKSNDLDRVLENSSCDIFRLRLACVLFYRQDRISIWEDISAVAVGRQKVELTSGSDQNNTVSVTVARKDRIVDRHVTKLFLLVDQRSLIEMGIPQFSIFTQLLNPTFREGDSMRNDVEIRLFFCVDFIEVLRGLRRASDNGSESVEIPPKLSEIGDCEEYEAFPSL